MPERSAGRQYGAAAARIAAATTSRSKPESASQEWSPPASHPGPSMAPIPQPTRSRRRVSSRASQSHVRPGRPKHIWDPNAKLLMVRLVLCTSIPFQKLAAGVANAYDVDKQTSRDMILDALGVDKNNAGRGLNQFRLTNVEAKRRRERCQAAGMQHDSEFHSQVKEILQEEDDAPDSVEPHKPRSRIGSKSVKSAAYLLIAVQKILRIADPSKRLVQYVGKRSTTMLTCPSTTGRSRKPSDEYMRYHGFTGQASSGAALTAQAAVESSSPYQEDDTMQDAPSSPDGQSLPPGYEPANGTQPRPARPSLVQFLQEAHARAEGGKAVVRQLEEQFRASNEQEYRHFVATDRDQYRVTPLHLAVAYGYLEVYIFLIRHGANPDAKTDHNTSIYAFAKRAECLAKEHIQLYSRILLCRQRIKFDPRDSEDALKRLEDLANHLDDRKVDVWRQGDVTSQTPGSQPGPADLAAVPHGSSTDFVLSPGQDELSPMSTTNTLSTDPSFAAHQSNRSFANENDNDWTDDEGNDIHAEIDASSMPGPSRNQHMAAHPSYPSFYPKRAADVRLGRSIDSAEGGVQLPASSADLPLPGDMQIDVTNSDCSHDRLDSDFLPAIDLNAEWSPSQWLEELGSPGLSSLTSGILPDEIFPTSDPTGPLPPIGIPPPLEVPTAMTDLKSTGNHLNQSDRSPSPDSTYQSRTGRQVSSSGRSSNHQSHTTLAEDSADISAPPFEIPFGEMDLLPDGGPMASTIIAPATHPQVAIAPRPSGLGPLASASITHCPCGSPLQNLSCPLGHGGFVWQTNV